MINKIRNSLMEKRPLIHCITNPIAINQCANAVIAVGATPIMAEHPREVREITKTSQALVLNLGNITDARIKSMKISARTAKDKGLPIVVDLVGIACSELRRNFALKLIRNAKPAVIKGNYSEIYALCNSSYKAVGIDTDIYDVESVEKITVELAKKYNSIILASGKTDIVTDGKRVFYIKNGTHQLAEITGTGCMLGMLCGCYISVCKNIYGIVAACSVLGICGELAETDSGNGSFYTALLDKLSVLNNDDITKKLKVEEKGIEET